jgi:uncharacterized protein (DUF1499 family)
MKRTGAFLKAMTLAAVLGGAWAFFHWPRLNEVETGRTPEYPDLKVRDYMTGEDKVAKAARATVERLPRWTLVAQGKGPGGTEIQAVCRTRLLRLEDDVTVRVRREGGRTRVSVRSKSRTGSADFGQNARNIELFLTELDRELFGVGGPG